MNLLVEITLRSTTVLAAGLVVAGLLRRQSAAVRHGVLGAALAASAIVAPLYWVVPPMGIAVPAVSGPAPVAVTAVPPPVAVSRVGLEAAPTSRASDFILFTWGLGALLNVALLVVALGRLRRLAASAVPISDAGWRQTAHECAAALGVRRRAALLQSECSEMPATWGVRRPTILLPAQARDWTHERVHAVLCHEFAHIRRRDWPVQLAAESLRAIYWFNPLVWLVCRRLRREAELACDDAVLRLGVPAPDYAVHLVEVARSCRRVFPEPVAVPMARRSTLEGRIAAMLNPRLARTALSRRALALTALGLLTLAVPTAALRIAQPGPLPLGGVVYDPSGGVLPQAALTLEDERQNKWQATSDAAGKFEFPPVGPGSYTLEVALAGFRSLRQTLTLDAASDWSRAVTLQVATVRESIVVREARPKPRASTGPAAPAPVRVGGNIRPPTKTRDVRPVYPPSMRDAAREGRVPLEAIIGREGAVVSVRVATAQVHPDFAQAAIDAVQQWQFTPTLLNGRPVEVVMTVTVEFELED